MFFPNNPTLYCQIHLGKGCENQFLVSGEEVAKKFITLEIFFVYVCARLSVMAKFGLTMFTFRLHLAKLEEV